jgi:hypothetical protein
MFVIVSFCQCIRTHLCWAHCSQDILSCFVYCAEDESVSVDPRTIHPDFIYDRNKVRFEYLLNCKIGRVCVLVVVAAAVEAVLVQVLLLSAHINLNFFYVECYHDIFIGRKSLIFSYFVHERKVTIDSFTCNLWKKEK